MNWNCNCIGPQNGQKYCPCNLIEQPEEKSLIDILSETSLKDNKLLELIKEELISLGNPPQYSASQAVEILKQIRKWYGIYGSSSMENMK